MIKTKAFISFMLLLMTLSACNQKISNRWVLGKAYAEKALKSALSDSLQHNVISNNKIIIKDSATAIKIAESILFSTYGKKDIRKQQPYEVYFLDYYWVISGTLPKGWFGGTFLIIMDARNSRIIQITHGR